MSRLYFLGVTTGSSSINAVFPRWMEELGHPEVRLAGLDFPPGGDAAAFRNAIARIKEDPLAAGALVTTHKISVFEAASDLFDFLDPYALRLGEVTAISKRDGRLEGHAIDAAISGLCLKAMLGAGYFRSNQAEALCLGAGGAGTAIALHFIDSQPQDRPGKLTLVDRSSARLERLARILGRETTPIAFEYHCHEDPEANDRIVAGLPPGSLVINATGMGKDLPGSPLTDRALFPVNGAVWELNYRGERRFLAQAGAQTQARNLRVADGWLCFLHGWTTMLEHVLHTEIRGALFDRLAAIAREAVR